MILSLLKTGYRDPDDIYNKNTIIVISSFLPGEKEEGYHNLI